mmetsp:Transcript_22073/g.71197  ORF Transcript_22073/g.71197 Transcript_22073/m.71197 type:complete len:328 (+) Transcript_22073:670-1653(+)
MPWHRAIQPHHKLARTVVRFATQPPHPWGAGAGVRHWSATMQAELLLHGSGQEVQSHAFRREAKPRVRAHNHVQDKTCGLHQQDHPAKRALMRLQAVGLRVAKVGLPGALCHVLEILHPLEARDELQLQRIRTHRAPTLPVDQLIQGVGEDARARQLERMRRLRLGRKVPLGLKFVDDELQRVQHERVSRRREHDAIASLWQTHQIRQAQVQSEEADPARQRARKPVEDGEGFCEDDAWRRACQGDNRRMSVHVDVGVDAALKPEDGVPPHVRTLHVRLERIIHMQQAGIAGHPGHPDDIHSRLHVVRCPHPEAQPDPRVSPLRLLR